MKMTKQMVLSAVLVFGAGTFAAKAQTSATVKDDLFAGTEVFAKGASDVTEISMDPNSLGMVGGKDKAKAHTMVLNVVRTYEYDKPGMYRIEDVDAFRNKLNTGEWHCSVHTRSLKTGESTDVCNKRREDGMVETAIITVEPKELTFIHTIRKKGESEHSEMGIYGISGLDSLAMLHGINPDVHVYLNGLSPLDVHIDSAKMQADIVRAMANMPKIDGAEMQKHMEEARKAMGDAQHKLNELKQPEPKQPE